VRTISRASTRTMRSPGARWYPVMSAILLAGLLANVRAADPAFDRGLESARDGRLAEAGVAFEKSLESQPSAGGFVNLGITEWQRGHAGAAILAWERAAWVNPFDESAKRNLKFARAVAQVDEPELRWFETVSTWLPPNFWVWLAGLSLWFSVGALVLPRVLRRHKSGWQQMLAALGLGAFIFTFAANIGVVTRTDLGVVIKKNAQLRLTPTSGSELTSTLSAGQPVRRIKTRGNFIFVRTPMATGWIDRTQVGLINE